MKLPENLRLQIHEVVHAKADAIDWRSLGPQQKSAQYEAWVRDPDVGGVLQRYIDPHRVRVYLKDTVIRNYQRATTHEPEAYLQLADIDEQTIASYSKPGGASTQNSTVCWGPAQNWKLILMSLYERSLARDTRNAIAIFDRIDATYDLPEKRNLIEGAARRLGINRVVWRQV